MPDSVLDTHGASRDALLEAFWTKVPGTVTPLRRGYPRVHANVPVRITGTRDGPLKTRTNDLSVGGLQIRCSRETGARLRPDPGAPPDAEPPAHAVTLLLTLDGRTLRVDAHATVAHLSLLPEADGADEVAVGFKFQDFEEGARAALMRFIEFHMCPAGL